MKEHQAAAAEEELMAAFLGEAREKQDWIVFGQSAELSEHLAKLFDASVPYQPISVVYSPP